MTDQNPRGFVAIAADQIDDDGHQWIEVLPTATNVRNGVWAYTVDRADLETGAEFIRANGDRIAIDYNHSTMEGGDSVAAGWFTGQAEVVDDPDRGPILRAEVEWTPQGVADIRSKRYRFISAEWKPRIIDAKARLMTGIQAILAATLTNRPLFKELAAVAAEDLIDSDQLDAVVAAHGQEVADLLLHALAQGTCSAIDAFLASVPKETQMSDKPDLTAVAKSLGLAEDADETAIAAAIKERDDKIAELESKVLPEDEVKNLVAQAAEGAQAKKDLDEMKVETMLSAAVTAGKILPAQKEAYATMARADFDGVKALIDATPDAALAHLKEIGTGDEDETEDGEPSDKQVATAAKGYKSTVADGVDEDTVNVDLKARKILADQGKDADTCTAAEYAAAVEKAGYADLVDTPAE